MLKYYRYKSQKINKMSLFFAKNTVKKKNRMRPVISKKMRKI